MSTATDAGVDAFTASDAGVDACAMCGGTSCVNFQDDPNNCGVCSQSCLGGACNSGVCAVFVAYSTDQGGIVSLDSDGQNFVWAISGPSGDIGWENVTNGNGTTIALPGGDNPIADGGTPLSVDNAVSVAIDPVSSDVYWFQNNAGATFSLGVAGFGPFATDLAIGAPVNGSISGISIQDGYAEVVGVGSNSWLLGYGGCSVAGAGTCSLQPYTTSAAASTTIVADIFAPTSSGIIFGDVTNGVIWGTASSLEFTGWPDPQFLATDGTWVYWSSYDGDTSTTSFVKGQLNGTPIVLATFPAMIGGLATDGTNLYWTVPMTADVYGVTVNANVNTNPVNPTFLGSNGSTTAQDLKFVPSAYAVLGSTLNGTIWEIGPGPTVGPAPALIFDDGFYIYELAAPISPLN